MMQGVGGGGHSKAAGAVLKGSLEEVQSRILNLLKLKVL
jgi:nanoRNase/pAp phosphatase (c-di-AMP/oligoRNAs hydrolase)